VGDGLGIVVQGGFLLALDAFFARRVATTQGLRAAVRIAPEPQRTPVAIGS
jgi:hypothetical protein